MQDSQILVKTQAWASSIGRWICLAASAPPHTSRDTISRVASDVGLW